MNDMEALVARPTRDPVISLWFSALVPGVALGLVTTALSLIAGGHAALSAAVGAGIAALALSASSVLHLICRHADPAMALGLAVMTYALVVLLMWAAYSQLGNTDWLEGTYAAGGVLFTGIGWVAGHMRGALKVRQPMYDETVKRG